MQRVDQRGDPKNPPENCVLHIECREELALKNRKKNKNKNRKLTIEFYNERGCVGCVNESSGHRHHQHQISVQYAS